MFWRVVGIGGVIEMPMPIAEDGGDIVWRAEHTGCSNNMGNVGVDVDFVLPFRWSSFAVFFMRGR